MEQRVVVNEHGVAVIHELCLRNGCENKMATLLFVPKRHIISITFLFRGAIFILLILFLESFSFSSVRHYYANRNFDRHRLIIWLFSDKDPAKWRQNLIAVLKKVEISDEDINEVLNYTGVDQGPILKLALKR